MILLNFIITLLLINPVDDASNSFQGAWRSDGGVMIITDGCFSYCEFNEVEFKYTYGGIWKEESGSVIFTYEYHTIDASKVGTSETVKTKIEKDEADIDGTKFSRIDNGEPGKLAGAWLFANRARDGEMGTPRSADSPRKTMKILSGARFQWIAYDVEKKQFMGTGGGTYTTVDGVYTENIEFFSRDQSRVGASLKFDFEIKGDEWHHKGLSSKGDPMYEIWELRD